MLTAKQEREVELFDRPCDTCRRRKVRCDRAFPNCQRCTKFQYVCSYADIPKKRGPPKGYSLKKALGYCQNVVSPRDGYIQTTNGHGIVQLGQKNYSGNSVFNFSGGQLSSSNIKSGLIQFLLSNSTIDLKQRLHISNTGRVDYFGDSPMAMLLTMYTLNHSSPESLTSLYHQPAQPPTSSHSQKLVNHLTEHGRATLLCIEAYFNFFHPYFPVIHKVNFLTNIEAQPPILVNMVCAIGAGYIPEVAQEYREWFSHFAVAHLRSQYLKCSIANMTALLLMANYQHSPSEFNKGWAYLGYAMRMGYALGLDRAPPKKIPRDQAEIRSRLWWWAHIMDKLYAFSLNRPWTQDCRLSSPPLPRRFASDIINGTPEELVKVECSVEFCRHLSELCHLMCLMVRRFRFTEAQEDSKVEEMEYLARATAHHLDLWLGKVDQGYSAILRRFPSWAHSIASYFIGSLRLIYYGTLVQLYQAFSGVNIKHLAEHYHQRCTMAANAAVALAGKMGSGFNYHSVTYKFYALSSAIMIQIRNSLSQDPILATCSRVNLGIGLELLKKAESFYPLSSECYRLATLLAKAEGVDPVFPST